MTLSLTQGGFLALCDELDKLGMPYTLDRKRLQTWTFCVAGEACGEVYLGREPAYHIDVVKTLSD